MRNKLDEINKKITMINTLAPLQALTEKELVRKDIANYTVNVINSVTSARVIVMNIVKGTSESLFEYKRIAILNCIKINNELSERLSYLNQQLNSIGSRDSHYKSIKIEYDNTLIAYQQNKAKKENISAGLVPVSKEFKAKYTELNLNVYSTLMADSHPIEWVYEKVTDTSPTKLVDSYKDSEIHGIVNSAKEIKDIITANEAIINELNQIKSEPDSLEDVINIKDMIDITAAFTRYDDLYKKIYKLISLIGKIDVTNYDTKKYAILVRYINATSSLYITIGKAIAQQCAIIMRLM